MIRDPLVSQTSFPVEISVATATNGRSRSLDVQALEMFPHAVVEAHPAEETAAADGEVQQAGDPAHRQAAGEVFELVQLSGQIAAADQCADGRSGDHSDLHAGFVERAQDTDMGPAAGRAAAERQGDLRPRVGSLFGDRREGRARISCTRSAGAPLTMCVQGPVQHGHRSFPPGSKNDS